MKLEHFTYGFNGKDYRLTKSSGVDKQLSDAGRHHLCRLGTIQPRVVATWIPEDEVVARTYLAQKPDDYIRSAMWNHTILIGIHDYIQIQNFDVVDKHFIREGDVAPERLEPLRIDTK